MQTAKIQISAGIVELRKPSAGIRNDAMRRCEWEPNNKHRDLLLVMEMLPLCIVQHPWGTLPLKEMLNNLETEEYDLLLGALSGVGTVPADVEKKSETLSNVSPQEEASTP